MLHRVTSKIVWLGRATTFLVGLAVIVALALATATTALAGTGVGAVFNLGETNRVDVITKLIGGVPGSSLFINNTSPDPAATALELRVRPTNPPLKTNSRTKVANLNADLLDGLDASALAEPAGYANVTLEGDFDPARSKGVNDVTLAEGTTNVYCFDLTFTPKVAVGSPFLFNSAVVATTTAPNPALTTCPEGYRDAAAKTFASSTSNDAAINFTIIFV